MKGTNTNKKSILRVKNNAQTSMQNDNHKGKQKVLLPTLKEQQRYMVYTLLVDKNIADMTAFKDFAAVHNNVLYQCNAFLGVFDGGKAGLIGVKYNPSKMRGIIRVNSRYVDKLKLCLGLIKNINGNNVVINNVAADCVFVSGMLNKAVARMDN